ncbi:chlorohydrolase family protein [Falsiroseomonas oryzae]|uniref:chlorohydrolase family protein n=1 Tax=Falsiroseomonas oryzae TaxID=2766473 RepID=UPI0022EAD25B|nr:chlorohydrolase family protein [Roseomonas sp. MO-31]
MAEPRTTLIRGQWVVAFDGTDHRIISPGVVVYRGDRIIHVGRDWDGQADEVIDRPYRLVIPGLISTHAHLRLNEGYRMVIDGGRRDFMRSGFTNYAGRKLAGGPSFQAPGEPDVAVRFCLTTHLLSGVTTVLEMDNGAPDKGETVAALAGQSGIRIYYSPSFTAADFRYAEDGRFLVEWDEAGGMAGLEAACDFVARHDGAHEGRLRGILVLNEFYTSTPALRHATRQAATRLGLRITTHFCEQLFEFHETVRRTSRTPAQLLADEGFLGPDVVLGHALYVAGHSLTAWPWPGDLELIAESGASVSHSPVAYARRGLAFESIPRFLRAGINLALGTDANPSDIISEMRMGAIVGKLVERDPEAPAARDLFRAATLGGAAALGRDDLGRLAPGAKADIVVVDFDNATIGPVIDPIRSLVYFGTGDMVERTVVDGRTVMADRQVLAWNQRAVLAEARRVAGKVWAGFKDFHWAGRTVDQEFPPSFDSWNGA